MLVYIAHALGHDPILRPRNIERVQRWFKFLVDYGPESWTLQVPWLIYALNLDEANYRERGIRDGQAVIKTYDIICLVGGDDTRASFGANAERDTFKRLGKGVCDLTFLGAEPPDKEIITNDGLFLGADHLVAVTGDHHLPGVMCELHRDNVSRVILKHLVR